MSIWRTARPPFLLLAPVCVLVGWATAARFGGHWLGLNVLLVMVGALAAHAAVNVFNEYEDFRSGLDASTRRTPFSGGSGFLPGHPQAAPLVLAMGVFMLLAVVAVGVWFLWQTRLGILPFGVAGLALVLAYTRYLTRSPLLCLWAPGAGFGLLMIPGTDYALTGTYSIEALAAGLVVFFLVNNLLLLNQFPDVEADRAAGRRHLLIRYGYNTGARVFAGQVLAAYGALVIAVVVQLLPLTVLVGLLTAPAAVWSAYRIVRFPQQPDRLAGTMAANVLVCLLTPVLMALGMILPLVLP